MPLMSAWPARDKGAMPLHTVGNALVLHAREQISAPARELAMSVAHDPDHDVVVLDAPDRMGALAWESVAAALPRRRRTGIRLVICGGDGESGSLVGQWLSERLSRTVVAPHGQVTRAAAGALFVHAGTGPGTGWIRHRPGREPQWEGKRFPKPEWDALAAEAMPTSSTGVAEPVPGGVWIHDSTDEAAVEQHREWLLTNVPCQSGTMVVLLGCPGTRRLPLDDINRFWRRLGEEDRRRARFAGFGPVDVPGRDPVGQAVADALSTPVVCYAGVPVGPPSQPQLFTVDDGGRLCWRAFAEELAYSPRERPAAPAPAPRTVRHRIPIELGEELGAGVYWYAEDTVVEVVQSGLWVRPGEVPRHADRIRSLPADPERPALIFDDSHGPRAHRMRTIAADVAAQLDPATRERTELLAASAVVAAAARGPALAIGRLTDEPADPVAVPETTGGPVEAAFHAPPAVAPAAPAEVAAPTASMSPTAFTKPLPVAPLPVAPPFAASALSPVDLSSVDLGPKAAAPVTMTADVPSPAAPAERVPVPVRGVEARLQPVPDRSASALPAPGRGLAEERAWLRRSLNKEYDQEATTVSRVLSQHPGLQGGNGLSADDALTDSVAVRIYLSAKGHAIDSALRAARKGPHVPFARCTVSGLTRLPSHRGATAFVTSPTEAQWRLLSGRSTLTEWGFLTALSEPSADLAGDTDVLLWSITGRRTVLLEPEGDDHADNRVLFLPGTAFKILERVAPAGDRRGRLLLREVSPNEINPDGRVQDNRASFDELATTSLNRYAERWAQAEPPSAVGETARLRIGAVPGLAETQHVEEKR